MDRRPVFLTGFMGAGKSTVGRGLAERLERSFVDTDELVERAEGRSIERIFRDDGEGAFREAEERAFLQIAGIEDAVVATGGGLFLGAAQRRAMKRAGVVLWIDVRLEVALERVGAGDTRPLWLPDDPIRFRAWFDRRRATYALAHGRIDGNHPPAVVVDAAIAELARRAPTASILRDP